MGKKDGITLLRGVVNRNAGNLRNPDGFLAHSGVTHDISLEKATAIAGHYPALNLNVARIALAGLLHDIGRPLQEDQLFHELRGWEYIRNEGVEMGIASDQEVVNRIADMMRPHGYIYERWTDSNNADARKEFEQSGSIDTAVLLPRTVEELIVMYSDEHNDNGIRVADLEERHSKLLERYADDATVMRTIRAGQLRVRQLCKLVDSLAERRLPLEQVLSIQPVIDSVIRELQAA